MKTCSLFISVYCILWLNGCALSPQQVTLSPIIDTPSQINRSVQVQVEVIDNRPQQSLGNRGGVYADSSHILPDRPLEESLLASSQQALYNLGLNRSNPTPFPVRLTLIVDQLSYSAEGNLPIQVSLYVTLRAKAVKRNREHSATFETNQKHRFLKAPTPEQNERIINELLSDTLSRLFNDPALLEFIQQ
jgi:uncharacterized lipoprotein